MVMLLFYDRFIQGLEFIIVPLTSRSNRMICLIPTRICVLFHRK